MAANDNEVMRILRVPPLQKLVVSIGDNRYQMLSEITEDRQKRIVLAAIGELISFVGGYETLVEEGLAPAMNTPPPSPALQTKADSLREQQEQFLARLEAERDALRGQPNPQPKFPILSGVRPATNPEPQTMAEQIDVILQRYIATDEALAGRGIHLIQSPSGSLHIEADGQTYKHPREIEDAKIQLAIKQALKEWESS